MTDAEQIEAWRKEFESEFDDGSQKYESGIYRNSHRESMWQGFLMAKRSQLVIELPEKCIAVANEPSHWIDAKRGYDACLDEVKKSITAAGYKYKVYP